MLKSTPGGSKKTVIKSAIGARDKNRKYKNRDSERDQPICEYFASQLLLAYKVVASCQITEVSIRSMFGRMNCPTIGRLDRRKLIQRCNSFAVL